MHLDGVHGTHGQARVHGERPVGGGHHFGLDQAQRRGQTLAAELYRVAETLPAAGHELVVGFLVAFRRGHHTVFKLAAFLVTALVQRRQGVFTQFG